MTVMHENIGNGQAPFTEQPDLQQISMYRLHNTVRTCTASFSPI